MVSKPLFSKTADTELTQEFAQWLAQYQKSVSPKNLEVIVPLVKERASFIKDLWTASDFFFEGPKQYDAAGVKRAIKDNTVAVISDLMGLLSDHSWDSAASLSESVKQWCAQNQYGVGSVMMPLRLFLVGAMKGPDVFDIMMVLGKTESLKRLESALDYFS